MTRIGSLYLPSAALWTRAFFYLKGGVVEKLGSFRHFFTVLNKINRFRAPFFVNQLTIYGKIDSYAGIVPVRNAIGKPA
jgi:hypothetical protein